MSPPILFLRLLILLFAIGLLMPARAAETLVTTGASWRFLDTGTNLGTAWRAPEFDDSLWNSGPAQLGFGDGDESTVINGGPSNARYRTIYFRNSFVITNLGALTNFAARLLRDDGGVVYVNGVEALRQNMAEGPITANSLSLSAMDAPEESTFYLQALPPAFFRPGTNFIAVEVHQATVGSSDLSFALELLANSPWGNQFPVVTLAQPAAGATFLTNAPIVVQATAYDTDGTIQTLEILRDGAVIASVGGSSLTITNTISATGTHTFTARATDSEGGVTSVTNGVGIHTAGQHLIVFQEFTTETNLMFQHNAFVRDGRLHLNLPPSAGGAEGGAFIPVKQFIRDGFDVTFRYHIYDLLNGGGDGIAFVIQNNPFLRSGGSGGGIGFSGISNSLAVAFDTWNNPESSDPYASDISVHTRGPLRNSEQQSNTLGVVSASLDGLHTVRILYTPGLLSVFLDNLTVPVLLVTNDLAATFPLDFGRAWLGLTASTGFGVESHDILSWSVLTPEPISLRVTQPSPNTILTAPVSLLVQASATAVTGSVIRVEFYDDGTNFGQSVGGGPYQVQWNSSRVGAHKLVAVAYDSLSNSISSEPFTVFVQAGDGRTTLLPPGSVWNYLDAGADYGSVWLEPSFNDTTWRIGPAQLGFGDGDEPTVIEGGPGSSRNPTTYFRRDFVVTNRAALTNLAVRVLRDDGSVVYLNGNEVFRSAMPAGPIRYDTLASLTASGNDETTNFYARALNPDLLLAGLNTLAVEIHQADLTSSDLSFDLELIANTPFGNSPPQVTLTGVTNGQTLAPGAALLLQATATDPGGAVVRLEFVGDGLLLGARTNAPFTLTWSNLSAGAHSVLARAINDQGVTNRSPVINFSVAPPPRLVDATRLPDGRFQMAFPTSAGANYQVQFSTNLLHWFNAGAPIAGTSQSYVWIDAGPPLTPTPPQTTPQRFYKVVVLPVP